MVAILVDMQAAILRVKLRNHDMFAKIGVRLLLSTMNVLLGFMKLPVQPKSKLCFTCVIQLDNVKGS